MFKTIAIILIIHMEHGKVLTAKTKIECGYKQCPPTRDAALNVHLIPHSHMDAGWVKTFDEYYFGTRTSVSTANVQLIYHSVLSELLHDKRRKFTFSETAYFWRWWKEQRPATRATFRTLVQEGRIEFAGGGWVQNDEATLDYLQIIDHFTWGLRKLNDTLGQCGKPKAAWQIDTYGHTREQTSLLAQMGYDGLFIGRVDHKEREAMIDEDRMEFMWRGSDVLGKMSDIMTHTLFSLYNAPEGFCFDFLCSDEPIVDDPDNRVYNAEKRVNDFIAHIERQAKYYDHDNIMVTMGGDFTYQAAANWFANMDKLINHVNTHPANISDVNIFYSTPSCYLKAIYLYGKRDKAIYTERGDYLPYGSDTYTYWTGFYTSRPSLKYLVKRAHVFLQVVKQITVIARMGDSYELHLLRHAVNLVLHHDAITGTSQQHVTHDFVRTLSEAIDACTKKVSNLLSYLTPTWSGSRRSKNSQQFVVCHQLNMTQCRFTETEETMLLLVYNPTSVKTYHHVRLPAIALHYSVRDYNDEEVEYQLVSLPAAVINLPGRTSTAIQELCFEAENIPPLGYSAFYISPVRDQLEENEYARKVTQNKNSDPEQENKPSISNEYIKVQVNKESGLLESIQHMDGVKIDLSQNYYYYSQGQQNLQSGAYSFRPDKNRPTAVAQRATYQTVRGTLVKEIRQRFTDWVTQVIRLYRGEEFVEFEWVIGPVPIGMDLGKEVVTIFHTNVSNNGHFYTDSNSRQMMKRTCWNETATQQQKKPVAGCYYPVTSRICIQAQNTSVAMCALTDRTQGGTSFNEGELELMLHRRLLTDDGFGLEESLNEEAFGVGLVVKGRHRIIFGNFRQDVEGQTFSERTAQAARRWHLEPWLFLAPGEKLNRRKWQNVRNKRYSALKLHALPRHVHILTLEPWKGGSVLLRLENTLEKRNRGRFKNEKPDGPEDYTAKASHITVHLRKLFLHMKIKSVRETTLAANQWLDDARQMDWSTRYVYSGADDDILAEDNIDYNEEVKVSTKEAVSKDTAPYSEEQEYTKRRIPGPRRTYKGRPKHKRINYNDHDIVKRSLNITDNIIENIINGTFIYNKNETITATTKKESVEDVESTTEIVYDDFTRGEFFNTTYNSTDNLLTIKDLTTRLITTKRPKPSFLAPKAVSTNPAKFFVDLEKDEDPYTSEEDLSSNLKKRSPKKRKRKNKPEIVVSDDGITKSIYEMYYKSKPRITAIEPVSRTVADVTEPRRRRNKNNSKSRRFKENHEYVDGTRILEVRQEDKSRSHDYYDVPSKRKLYKLNYDESREETFRDKIRNRKNKESIRYYDEDRVTSAEDNRRTKNRSRYYQNSKRNYEVEPTRNSKGIATRNGRFRKTEKTLKADMPFFITDDSTSYSPSKRSDPESTEDMPTDTEYAEEKKDTPYKELNNQRNKRRKVITDAPEEDEAQVDMDEEEKEMDNEDRETNEGKVEKRKKRASPQEELQHETINSEQVEAVETEPEFVITLRPTQIRTFVVWFETSKKFSTLTQ